MKTSVDDEFELPEVGLLTELIDEPEDDFSDTQSDSVGQSEVPQVVAPLRLPGRIYRDKD